MTSHKYLYFLKLQHFYQPLAELETFKFFTEELVADQRIITNNTKSDITDAVFIDFGAEILAQAATLGELRLKVKELQVTIHQGKVLTPTAGLHPEVKTEDLFQILEFVEGTFNLNKPEELYALVRDHDYWYFSKVFTTKSNNFYKHSKKPFTFSSALNAMSARAAVNLLSDVGPDFLDCGCGSGSVTLEACDSGLNVFAIDRHHQPIEMTGKNLKHFNYTAHLELRDLKDWKQKVDSAIIDFPYGFACHRDEADEKMSLKALFPLTKQVVFFASSDLTAIMEDIGYRIIKTKVMDYPNVTRHIIYAYAGRTEI